MKKALKYAKSHVMLIVLLILFAILCFFMIKGIIDHRNADKESTSPTETGEETATAREETSESTTEEAASSESEETTTTVPETEVETEEKNSAGGYEKLFVAVGSDSVNVRKSPSTESEIVAVIPKFGGGEVIEGTDDGEWYHIMSGGIEGYVASFLVKTGKDARLVAEENLKDRVKITGEKVNVRRAASGDAEILTQVLYGRVFDLLGEENGFYKIAFKEGTDCYVSSTVAEKGQYLLEAGSEVYTEKQEETSESETEKPGETSSGTPTAPSAQGYTAGSNGLTVCIDAGHQQAGISEKEPNGPGSTEMKAKLTTGTAGCATGRAEYVVNLEVSLLLQQELVNRGYNVVMIRTTHDCPLSNAERAQVANQSGADCFIRVHCNSVANSAVQGIMTYGPTAGNPYMSADNAARSISFSQLVLDRMCQATGWPNKGYLLEDTMTGINWCQIPVTIVEMGFMSNPTDDAMLSDPAWQQVLAVGMANGIDAFFGR